MAIVSEKIKEIMEDLGGRIRNPLILSFVLVWLYLHWQLVYLLFTMDMTLPIDSRLGSVKTYVSQHNNWLGMIGKPLFWAFISLVVYYLIAIAAQAIKVLFAKRLNAYMLAKIDTGAYALKVELTEEKNNAKRLRKELEANQTLLKETIQQKQDYENRIQELNKEIIRSNELRRNAETNISNNERFIEKHKNTLLFLLASYKSIQNVPFTKTEKLRDHYSVINGNWKTYRGGTLLKNGGTPENFMFNNMNVSDFFDKPVGSVENLIFDRGYSILTFDIGRAPNKRDQFNLIVLNPDAMIGFYNNEFVSFERQV